ncbi:MAG: TadE/TadG family type IV pilus assembly protein [Litorimonas sp.]
MTTQKRRAAQALAKDESGVAAMEFAIIAPLIIGLYLGLAELANVLSVERQVSHSASVAGDLATQVTQLTATDTSDMMSAVLRVAGVRDTSDYVVHLESFERDSSGAVQSLGTVVYNQAKETLLPSFDSASLGTDMLSEDSGIVIARVAYRYRPFGFTKTGGADQGGSYLTSAGVTLSETFLLKPRKSPTLRVGTTDGTAFTCRGTASRMRCS